MALKDKLKSSLIPIALAAAILVVMGLIVTRDTRKLMARGQDLPPRIEFTWNPAGPVSLLEMKGFLTIKDDYGIDFTTYRMRLPDLDKTMDLPIDGLIGKDYEQPVSFSLLADNPKLAGKDRLTVEISVADDRGQKSSLTRVIMLKHN
ncbi:MAG TPA: hypothetical protein VL500_07850 [Candidatus Eisenbacteria bacterium]|jgi:hypothetical protein|nr:hypothetical protein [Candidatus Eisenbacteria bacterium]